MSLLLPTLRPFRTSLESFFAAQLRRVKGHLHKDYLAYDRKRAQYRQDRLQATHDKQLDAEAGYRFGTHGRKPQLWQIEGDRE